MSKTLSSLDAIYIKKISRSEIKNFFKKIGLFPIYRIYLDQKAEFSPHPSLFGPF